MMRSSFLHTLIVYLTSIILLFGTTENIIVTTDLEVIKIDSVSYSWQTITYKNSYTQAPIIVCTYNLPDQSGSPAVVRIDARTTTDFKIKIQKPIDDSGVTASAVECIVAKEGEHILDGGNKLDAVKILSTDTSGLNADGWNGTGEDISSLITDHGSTPVVLGQVMSYNDNNFSQFWSYDCSAAGNPPANKNVCVGKHIGESTKVVDARLAEDLGYIVIDGDSDDSDTVADPDGYILTSSGGIPPIYSMRYYRVAVGNNTIDGVDNSGASYDLGRDYSLGVATQSAMNGGDGGRAVFYGSDPFAGNDIDLAIDEDTLGDSERAHTTEKVAYFVVTEDLGYDWMEIQKISNVGSAWTTVNFNNTYTTPIPVCIYNLKSNSDNEAVVRINNLSGSSMNIRLQRPQNGTDVNSSDVYCMVVEEGTHTIGGGFLDSDSRSIEAYRVTSDKTNNKNNWLNTQMEHPSYDNSYNAPVVLGQVITYNDERFSVFWSSNGTKDKPPDATNLYVGKHIGEDPDRNGKYRADEMLGVIVATPHEGLLNSVYYDLAVGGDSVKGVGDSPSYDYSFSGLSHTQYRYGVSTQVAMNGGQGGWAVHYGSDYISDKVRLAVDEETVAGDTGRTHTTEQVAYWVWDPFPDMSIDKSSMVTEDPVNGTNNPKRIPSATIRYCFTVDNTGAEDADDIVIKDKLVGSGRDNLTYIKSGSVIQDISTACDCSNITDENGTISGDDVNISIGTLTGRDDTAHSRACGYVETELK